jgi:putative ABC transport system permease protein
MFAYQLRIAGKSLRRTPGYSTIVAGGIALGVAVSTLFATVLHSIAKDPIPDRSDQLFYVRMDSWGLEPHPGGGPPPQVTYQDAMALMRSDIPVRQNVSFKSSMYVFPDPKLARPRPEMVRLCFSDFFEMFEVPFRYGGAWDRKADQGPEPVVVLSEAMNERLFGGEDSVGRSVRIEDRQFRVVGVLDRWLPSIRFYDMTQNPVMGPEDVFMPFHHAERMEIRTDGNSDNWKPFPSSSYAGLLASETVWLQMWVELPGRERFDRYRAFLDAYTLEQRKAGRFQRKLDNRLSTPNQLIEEFQIVPPELKAMFVVSLLFLLICSLNLIGLLFGKFLARAAEIGVRRAMGASRINVFLQHVIECEVIALVGGLVGLPLAAAGVAGINLWCLSIYQRRDLLQMDWTMAGFAAAAALAAGLVAGIYPAFRVCRIAPAVHLKAQ